ncbi:MAG: response regulator transcription factor [Chloroflexota bacterium]|nr:response regulator transcription factor [Chloroflexota bacterium]
MNEQQRTTGQIIIADDLPHVRASIRAMLTLALGAQVVGEAGTAGELLALLATTEADIIIVDRDLSGLDDATVVGEMRRLAPTSRIVLCSVFERTDGMRACPLTADFTLSKSLGPDHWLAALNRMLMAHEPGVINIAVEKSSEMMKMHGFPAAECPVGIPPVLPPSREGTREK